jgi:hypothetical protein
MRASWLLLIALLAAGQTAAQDPEKKEEKKQEPARPLILRIDQLPPEQRTVGVREEPSQKTDGGLPELGGKPSTAYGTSGTRGSGTSAPGSPYPKDTQPN